MMRRSTHTRERTGLLILDTADCLAAEIEGCGIGGDQAQAISRRIVDHMLATWGGGIIYLPRGNPAALAQRNAKIAASFDGHNLSDLARRHGLTPQRIAQILRAAKA